MISPSHTTSLAVLCCIAFAASTPINIETTTLLESTPINIETTDLPEASCQPPIADSDQLLYQSFESMHKWVDNKLDAKTEDFKHEAAQVLAELQKTIGERTKQELDKLQQAVDGKKAKIAETFSQIQETIKSNVEAMKSEMSRLKSELSEMSNVGAQVTALKEQIKSQLVEQNQQMQQQATAIQDLNDRVAQCVTDIKVAGPESVPIWNGPGYGDESDKGYVITGVRNDNNDHFADTTHRRMVSFLKNNVWTPLHA